MSETSNFLLRYYIIEDAQMAVVYNPVYVDDYHKKYNEVKIITIGLTAFQLLSLPYYSIIFKLIKN